MKLRALLLSLALFLVAGVALAESVVSAHPGGFPTPVTSVGREVMHVYNFMFWICAVIFILVQGVLLYCIFRFRRNANPKPANFSHNVPLEIVWTVIPAIICIAIAWKSFVAMHYIRSMPAEGLDVDVIAYQFGWDFDYPEAGMSAPEPEKAHALLSSAGEERYVKTMVVPVDTNVKLHITARDVIHAYFVPKLGIKIDAIPGRINYQWFKADEEGEFIGQCAELCGAAHGEMFFLVKVVSKDDYKNWVNEQRVAFGDEPLDEIKLTALVD